MNQIILNNLYPSTIEKLKILAQIHNHSLEFVVDANVAIKWVLTEIHSEAALRLLDERLYNALSTDVLFSNICWIEDIP